MAIKKPKKEVPVVEEVNTAPPEPVIEQAPVVEEALVQGLFSYPDMRPIDPEDYAYEIKAGKGTFRLLSSDNVFAFVEAVLGKVDKIVITKL